LLGDKFRPLVQAGDLLASNLLLPRVDLFRIGTRGSVDNLLNGAAPIPEVLNARLKRKAAGLAPADFPGQ
jgi:hypothetical protein